jgi:hypothetical protein
MTVQPKHSLPRLVARFLSGRDLDGIRRTDATFTQRASKAITVHGRAPSWAHKPGYHRLTMRLAFITGITGAIYGWLNYRMYTLAIASAGASAEICYLSYRLRNNLRMWAHRQHVIYPLWHTLAGLTGYPLTESRYLSIPRVYAGLAHHSARENPEKYLTIPRDYETNDNAIVRFEPPYTWLGEVAQQKAVSQAITRRLGGDWAATWHLNESPKYVALCRAPKPPARVTLAEFIKHIDACPDHKLALGIGTSGQLVAIDLDSEAPHIALSMGTGGGKSDTVALIIAILVRKGCERIDVIDPKRVSHNWARGLPGVHIHRYVNTQMEAIHNARVLMDSRYDDIDANDEIMFPRHVIIIEEQNSLMTDLKDYWDDLRRDLEPAERAKVPRVNPAIADLRYILNKGRQSRINVISIFQRCSANAAGGGDARENYGAKILARYSPQTWKILVGTSPVPRSSRVPGRAMFVLGDDHREVQRAHAGITTPDGKADRDAIARLRAFALNGRAEDSQASPEPAQASGADDLVSLREACDTGALTLRLSAARRARTRDSEFPRCIQRGNVKLYRACDLSAWQANRARAHAGR